MTADTIRAALADLRGARAMLREAKAPRAAAAVARAIKSAEGALRHAERPDIARTREDGLRAHLRKELAEYRRRAPFLGADGWPAKRNRESPQ